MSFVNQNDHSDTKDIYNKLNESIKKLNILFLFINESYLHWRDVIGDGQRRFTSMITSEAEDDKKAHEYIKKQLKEKGKEWNKDEINKSILALTNNDLRIKEEREIMLIYNKAEEHSILEKYPPFRLIHDNDILNKILKIEKVKGARMFQSNVRDLTILPRNPNYITHFRWFGRKEENESSKLHKEENHFFRYLSIDYFKKKQNISLSNLEWPGQISEHQFLQIETKKTENTEKKELQKEDDNNADIYNIIVENMESDIGTLTDFKTRLDELKELNNEFKKTEEESDENMPHEKLKRLKKWKDHSRDIYHSLDFRLDYKDKINDFDEKFAKLLKEILEDEIKTQNKEIENKTEHISKIRKTPLKNSDNEFQLLTLFHTTPENIKNYDTKDGLINKLKTNYDNQNNTFEDYNALFLTFWGYDIDNEKRQEKIKYYNEEKEEHANRRFSRGCGEVDEKPLLYKTVYYLHKYITNIYPFIFLKNHRIKKNGYNTFYDICKKNKDDNGDIDRFNMIYQNIELLLPLLPKKEKTSKEETIDTPIKEKICDENNKDFKTLRKRFFKLFINEDDTKLDTLDNLSKEVNKIYEKKESENMEHLQIFEYFKSNESAIKYNNLYNDLFISYEKGKDYNRYELERAEEELKKTELKMSDIKTIQEKYNEFFVAKLQEEEIKMEHEDKEEEIKDKNEKLQNNYKQIEEIKKGKEKPFFKQTLSNPKLKVFADLQDNFHLGKFDNKFNNLKEIIDYYTEDKDNDGKLDRIQEGNKLNKEFPGDEWVDAPDEEEEGDNDTLNAAEVTRQYGNAKLARKIKRMGIDKVIKWQLVQMNNGNESEEAEDAAIVKRNEDRKKQVENIIEEDETLKEQIENLEKEMTTGSEEIRSKRTIRFAKERELDDECEKIQKENNIKYSLYPRNDLLCVDKYTTKILEKYEQLKSSNSKKKIDFIHDFIGCEPSTDDRDTLLKNKQEMINTNISKFKSILDNRDKLINQTVEIIINNLKTKINWKEWHPEARTEESKKKHVELQKRGRRTSAQQRQVGPAAKAVRTTQFAPKFGGGRRKKRTRRKKKKRTRRRKRKRKKKTRRRKNRKKKTRRRR